ncbi:hypothetical protein [uncultured Photobacterium sp.]|uniref:hypothetical protein n=1 Tax=uncultured Photobacterium sp. TaxID=173973 RepID=UPI00262E8004|nr:hypothetical protein [uncultured Photobacterium sp.]
MNVFLVSSPLQCKSVVRVLEKHGTESLIHVRYNSNDRGTRNDSQILFEISKISDPNVRVKHIAPKNNKYINVVYLHFVYFVLWFNYRSKAKNLFFGSFYNYYFNFSRLLFSHCNQVLIDDGTATLTAQVSHINKGTNIVKPRATLFHMLFNVITFLKGEPKIPSVHSVFDLSKVIVDGQCYENLDDTIRIKKETVSNQVSFVGCPYSEHLIITEDEELKLLREFYLRNKDKEVIYYPHRYESKDKLTKVADIGFTVTTINVPLEEFLSESERLSFEFSSFTSTVLYNIYSTYEFVNIGMIDATELMTSESEREKYRCVVEFYLTLGFNKYDF